MKVFVDLHHSDLYWALHRLFEDRLDMELYRPIGLDWFHEGFWKIAEPYGNSMDTVGQYLNIGNQVWDAYNNLNGNHYLQDGVYHIYEPVHGYHQKAVTLEQFKQMKFDIIISSYKPHDAAYERLRNMYQPDAKVVAHMGNNGQTSHLPNVIHSVPYTPRTKQNLVYLHQEIDLNLYKYVPLPEEKTIYSVVNCAPMLNVYNTYKAQLPEVKMRHYGASSPDGALFGAKGVAEKMQEASMGWHIKPGGGLGHSTMGWAASGRPMIVMMSQSFLWGADLRRLLEPGVTCIDLDSASTHTNVANIRRCLEPEVNKKMSETMYERYKEVFNYEAEEQLARQFIERLV